MTRKYRMIITILPGATKVGAKITDGFNIYLHGSLKISGLPGVSKEISNIHSKDNNKNNEKLLEIGRKLGFEAPLR